MRKVVEMLRGFLLLLPLLFVFGACGGSQIAGECAETAKVPCLTGKICTHDPDKGCEMCYCKKGDQKYPMTEDPNAVGKDPMSPP